MKKAFTLIEVMITLTVIGIITSIIIPVAIQSKPDENLMKFKKAHNTLWQAISTLINSDKYYLDGDLGIKADGSDVGVTYFCRSFASVVTTKKTNCIKVGDNFDYSYWAIEWPEEYMDNCCLATQKNNFEEIVTTDDVTYYEPNSFIHFKTKGTPDVIEKEDGSRDPIFHANRYLFYENLDDGINRVYKIFCIDVDGLNKGEAPFGYGIRVDGKIFVGPRAKDWLEKSIQG